MNLTDAWGAVKKIVIRYCFTLGIGLLVILVSLLYNLLISPGHDCTGLNWIAKDYLALTAPFNIGCESPITQINTPVGQIGIFGNLIVFLALIFLVETGLNYFGHPLKQNVFFASILASYTSFGIDFFILSHNGLSAGTSIIGVSMSLTLIGLFLWGGWKSKAKIWIFVVGLLFAGGLGWLTIHVYNTENVLHTMGGTLFLVYMGMLLIDPYWLDRVRGKRMPTAPAHPIS